MSKKIWYAPHKFDCYGQEEINNVINCLNDGWLAGTGNYTKQFEIQISDLFDKKYGLFVNSGSSANILALACLKLPKNSKVITPSCTFITSVSPIIQLNLEPVFCDVQLCNFVPSVNQIIELIDKDVKAILIPNLIGYIFNWKELREHLIKINRKDIYLIEDSCDTITPTKYSDIATTSFYATHLITAGGMGGMVMFNNENLYKKARIFRDWGRSEIHNDTNFYENELLSNRLTVKVDDILYDSKYLFKELPYHMKCCEMCAAFGLSQITKLEKIKKIRRNNLRRYYENLKNTNNIILPDDSTEPNLLALPLLIKGNRNDLMKELEKNNIQSRAIFSGNITRHPPFRKYFKIYKNADEIMKNGILVGIHQGLSLDDIDKISLIIKKFLQN